jgi:hypothetical protein
LLQFSTYTRPPPHPPPPPPPQSPALLRSHLLFEMYFHQTRLILTVYSKLLEVTHLDFVGLGGMLPHVALRNPLRPRHATTNDRATENRLIFTDSKKGNIPTTMRRR